MKKLGMGPFIHALHHQLVGSCMQVKKLQYVRAMPSHESIHGSWGSCLVVFLSSGRRCNIPLTKFRKALLLMILASSAKNSRLRSSRASESRDGGISSPAFVKRLQSPLVFDVLKDVVCLDIWPRGICWIGEAIARDIDWQGLPVCSNLHWACRQSSA